MSQRPHRRAQTSAANLARAEGLIEEALKKSSPALNLSGLGLTELPSIGRLTHLRELNLGNNRLRKLPLSLGQLTRLQILNLSRNNLTELSDAIRGLTQLGALYAGRNQLTKLPHFVGELKNLQILFLDNNLLTELPESICNLSRFTWLFLRNNRLSELPEFIGRMSPLQGLYVPGNRLSELPDSIGQLNRLEMLDLDGNKLTRLPKSLLNLKRLRLLRLHGNRELGIPTEILGRGNDSSIDGSVKPSEVLGYYFRARGGERRPLNEAKLILVGRGAVGKTSIVNRLVHGEFKEEKKTEGIRITEWPLTVGSKKDKVRLNVWDFGGQEIMHATHQFFLTERSLYLLVLSGREGGEDAEAEYWLKLIQSFGGNSPVVVVLNKIKEHPFDVNRSALQQKYPFIREFIRTDCKAGAGIVQLRRIVERETDRLEHLRDAFPAAWFSIKDKLAGMRKNYLDFDEFRKECARLGEEDAEGQERLAFYLHVLGIALNYRDDPRLQDTHVLNPQ